MCPHSENSKLEALSLGNYPLICTSLPTSSLTSVRYGYLWSNLLPKRPKMTQNGPKQATESALRGAAVLQLRAIRIQLANKRQGPGRRPPGRLPGTIGGRIGPFLGRLVPFWGGQPSTKWVCVCLLWLFGWVEPPVGMLPTRPINELRNQGRRDPHRCRQTLRVTKQDGL